jgi:hypothetical protein
MRYNDLLSLMKKYATLGIHYLSRTSKAAIGMPAGNIAISAQGGAGERLFVGRVPQ